MGNREFVHDALFAWDESGCVVRIRFSIFRFRFVAFLFTRPHTLESLFGVEKRLVHHMTWPRCSGYAIASVCTVPLPFRFCSTRATVIALRVKVITCG